MEKISTKEIHSVIAQLLTHAESVSWNRFHSFLMLNSILVLIWVIIYVSSVSSGMVTTVLTAICVLGAASGVFWSCLGVRGREFVKLYMELGCQIEADPTSWTKELEKYKPLTESKNLRDKGRYGWSGSRHLLKFGPLCFSIVYILLGVASWIR